MCVACQQQAENLTLFSLRVPVERIPSGREYTPPDTPMKGYRWEAPQVASHRTVIYLHFPLHKIEGTVQSAKVNSFAYSRYTAPSCCTAHKCEKQERDAVSSLPPLCFLGAHSSPCDCEIHLPASPCHQ